ncbi:hypothetical protein HAX54_017084 [Datura stramonium]|uniref:Uncharacterized protein n=1 Tax=Datura stramonium TaxID=4076 RepID=A0ABS8UMB2_DATST|nr:hypothetical protein [Datura stramonium]
MVGRFSGGGGCKDGMFSGRQVGRVKVRVSSEKPRERGERQRQVDCCRGSGAAVVRRCKWWFPATGGEDGDGERKRKGGGGLEGGRRRVCRRKKMGRKREERRGWLLWRLCGGREIGRGRAAGCYGG